MTDIAERVVAPAMARRRRRSNVVLARTARAASRSGLLWGYVFGATIASAAWSYSNLYATQAQRNALAAAFGDNKATIALFGPAPSLETVGGFTVFKVSMTIWIVGAIWGLLTSSRLLRGEEDAGRWEVLLSGPTTRGAAALQGLGGLFTGAGVVWALTALITSVAGVSAKVGIAPGPAMYFALALVSPVVMFLAVGALTSQLAPTRRRAAGLGAAVLAISYGLRMVGDAGIGLHWMTWLSPIGWCEMLTPLTGATPWPLVLITAFTVLTGLAAVRLAATRDVGSSIVADRSERPADLRLLGGPLGLSARLLAAVASVWLVVLVCFGLLFGLVATAAGDTLSGSSVLGTLDKLGATGGGVGAYLGVTFLIVSALIAFAIAGQVAAARGEEAEGRLDHLVVATVSRTRWLTGRLALALALAIAGGLVAAMGTWLGAATQHARYAIGPLLGAGTNAAVPAVVCLGLGVLLLGVWPRAAVIGVYAIVGWSLLVELIGGIGDVSHWLLDTSIFHHVTAAPAVAPDWVANASLVAIGVASAVIGIVGFRRRDLVSA